MSTNLFCHNCDQEREYVVEVRSFTYSVREMDIPITGKLAFCAHCGSELFHSEYDQANQDQAFEIYRAEKGILSPEEIVTIRKGYGLTQRDYSRLLGFGEITITRYENGSLPTLPQNQIIRDSANPNKMLQFLNSNRHKISDKEAKRLESQLSFITHHNFEDEIIQKIKDVFHQESDDFSGNQTFSYEKFSQMVLFFAQKEKPYKTKLNKLMYYADNYFYKIFGRSISGSRYICHNYGPVPDKYETLYANIKDVEVKEDFYGEIVVPTSDAGELILDKAEKEILELVYLKFRHMSSKQISDFSHEEKGWKEVPYKEYIPYTYADYLDPNRK